MNRSIVAGCVLAALALGGCTTPDTAALRSPETLAAPDAATADDVEPMPRQGWAGAVVSETPNPVSPAKR